MTRPVPLFGASQVENIIRHWAIHEHGFTDAVEVESHASFDSLFIGITLEETSTVYTDPDDTVVEE